MELINIQSRFYILTMSSHVSFFWPTLHHVLFPPSSTIIYVLSILVVSKFNYQVNNWIWEKYEMKDSFTPSKFKIFWKKLTLQMTTFSFVASQLFSWRIIKYIWYVAKIMVLLCELSTFICLYIILHNFK